MIMFFGKRANPPCEDCCGDQCTMNCWRPALPPITPLGITYSAAMNPSPARPYDNLRSIDEIHASAIRENAWFCEWLESGDPRNLVRMFRAEAEWHAVSARGSVFEV